MITQLKNALRAILCWGSNISMENAHTTTKVPPIPIPMINLIEIKI